MRIAPKLVAPVDDAAIRIHGALHRNRHGRPERLPGKLVLMCQLQLDWAAGDGTRQQHGIESGIICAVVAVASRPFNMADGDRFDGQAQRQGDVLACRMDRLALAPDFDAPLDPARHGARRPERGMGNERT
jgi:hypothetical protein